MSERNTARAIVIVHSLAHAIAAAERAVDAGRPVLLRSARGAAGYAGISWFAAVIAETRARVPGADIVGSIDCADDLALAFEAVGAGIDAVRYDGGEAGLAKLRAVAARCGVALDETAGESLDLAKADDFARFERHFMSRGPIFG